VSHDQKCRCLLLMLWPHPEWNKTHKLSSLADFCWNGTFVALIPQNKAIWASSWTVQKIYFEKLWTLKLEIFLASDLLSQSCVWLFKCLPLFPGTFLFKLTNEILQCPVRNMGQLMTEIHLLLLDRSHRIRRHLVRSVFVWNVK